MARRPRNPERHGQNTREPYDRVLIVTEGEKTEPEYFAELARRYRLSTANIEVIPSDQGTDPANVVRAAANRRDEEEGHGERFDRVYCVFDRDSHANFDAASELATRNEVLLARSWPCFEYWLLLHFEFTRAPFAAVGGRSSCDLCIRALRVHLAEYEKALPGVFSYLESRLERAKSHARRALKDVGTTGAPNPSTEVHELVEYLQGLKAGAG